MKKLLTGLVKASKSAGLQRLQYRQQSRPFSASTPKEPEYPNRKEPEKPTSGFEKMNLEAVDAKNSPTSPNSQGGNNNQNGQTDSQGSSNNQNGQTDSQGGNNSQDGKTGSQGGSNNQDRQTGGQGYWKPSIADVTNIIVATTALFGIFSIYPEYRSKKIADEKAISTQLGLAVIQDGYKGVKKLLSGDKAVDVSAKDKNGDTPLHHAARMGDVAIIQLLIQFGANLYATNAHGATPFYEACVKGSSQAVQLLCEEPEKKFDIVNASTNEGISPFFEDCMNGYLGTAQLPEEPKEEFDIVNMSTKEGISPLLATVWNNHESVFKFLLAHGAKIDANTADFSTAIALCDNAVMVQRILKTTPVATSVLIDILSKAIIQLQTKNPIDDAYQRRVEIIKQIICKIPENEKLNTKLDQELLHKTRDFSLFRLLIENFSYSSDQYQTDLTLLQQSANPDIQAYLLCKLADRYQINHAYRDHNRVNVIDNLGLKRKLIEKILEIEGLVPGSEAFINRKCHLLISMSFITPAKKSLEKNEIEVVNKRLENFDSTFLEECSYAGCLGLIEELFKKARASDKPLEIGGAPFIAAVSRGHMSVVEYLWKQYVTNNEKREGYINLQDKEGNTPLCLAVSQGNGEMARFLLKNCAEVNTANHEGDTPLHLAAKKGNAEMAKLLLEEPRIPARLEARNNGFKRTALHEAARGGHDKVIEVLLEHGAYRNAKTAHNRTAADITQNERTRKLIENYGVSLGSGSGSCPSLR